MNIVHPKRLIRLPAMRKLFAAVALLSAGYAHARHQPGGKVLYPGRRRWMRWGGVATEKQIERLRPVTIMVGVRFVYNNPAVRLE